MPDFGVISRLLDPGGQIRQIGAQRSGQPGFGRADIHRYLAGSIGHPHGHPPAVGLQLKLERADNRGGLHLQF